MLRKFRPLKPLAFFINYLKNFYMSNYHYYMLFHSDLYPHLNCYVNNVSALFRDPSLITICAVSVKGIGSQSGIRESCFNCRLVYRGHLSTNPSLPSVVGHMKVDLTLLEWEGATKEKKLRIQKPRRRQW